MSASTERKNRAAAREAGTDKKMLAQQEAAKKAATSKRRWTIGTILVAVLLIVILLLNTGFVYKHTTAATVGEEKFSPVELSYYYLNQYSNFLSTYGSYASLFGLDTTQGVASLGQQACPMLEEGQTWRDYFLQGALSSMQQITAMKNYAKSSGITLDESELKEIEDELALAEQSAKSSGFSSLNNYFSAQFGTGMNTATVRRLTADGLLANKALQSYADSLSYSDQELEDYYASLDGASDLFDYAYYYVAAETVPGEAPADGGEAENVVTDETLLEARMTAEAIETAYQDGGDIADPTERLNAAVEAEFDADSATVRSAVSGGSLGDMSDFLRDASRKAGDAAVVEDASGSGYYVVVFLSREDNHYPTVSVRHILIKAEASEDGTYTPEASMAALERINEIKAEYESGEKTEERFAALAEQYSEDAGSNTNGGLYENIYKGQMVADFDAFCFEGHKSGDIGVVYGESGSYAGYHLIYFVGEGELYSNVIARNALTNTAVNDFIAEKIADYEPQLHFWSRYAGR